MSEHQEQVALFDWAEMAKGRYPELALLYAIPNGGKRHIVTAVKLKREGVKAGVPDVCLPVKKEAYSGLYIEMKNGKKGRVSDSQEWWLKSLQEQDYRTVVCRSAEEAIGELKRYLEAD